MKKSNRIFGRKTSTEPTPVMIPSPTRDANHPTLMAFAAVSASQPKKSSIMFMKGVAKVKVTSKAAHISARNMGIPRYLFVTTRSTISDPLRRVVLILHTCRNIV